MPPPIPYASISQTDGALSAQPGDAVHAKAGVCSAGPLNTPTLVATKTALTSTFGRGPLVEDVAYQLDVSGAPVLVCRLNPGVAGAIGSVARSGGGSPSASVALDSGGTSTAVAALAIASGVVLTRPLAVRLKVASGGSNLAATPTVRYSLDGGLTWSAAATAVAGPTALGSSGLTLTWTDGSFVADDTWTGRAVPGAQQGTCTLAVTGTATDAYRVALEILRGGATLAANTATYRLSLDGGETWGPETAMPVAGVVTPSGTGLTLTFTYSSGTGFTAGDRFDCATSAPGFTLSDLTSGWNALLASTYDWEGLHVVGTVDSTIAAGADALAAAAIASYKPRWLLLSARDQTAEETEAAWISALQTEFASFVSTLGRIFIAAGALDLVSTLSGRARRTSVACTAAARAALAPISEDLAWVGRGALPGVLRIHHDEASVPGLNASRFITARTHEGRIGYYLTNPNGMVESGSDFELLQYRRVWDRAYRVLRRTLLPFLSQDLEVNPAGVPSPLVAGGIDEVDAGNIERKAVDALEEALVKTTPRHATTAGATVDRTTNFLSTRDLSVAFTVQPKGYVKSINGTLGFVNPARTAQ